VRFPRQREADAVLPVWEEFADRSGVGGHATGSAECKEGGNMYNTFSYTTKNFQMLPPMPLTAMPRPQGSEADRGDNKYSTNISTGKMSLQKAAGPGVFESDMNIEDPEIEPGGRRLLAESIKVRSTIKVPSQAAADTMAKALPQKKINDELSKSGLPAATDVVVLASGTTAAPALWLDQIKSEATSAIIGVAIAGVVSVAGLLVTYFRKWISSKCGCSEESDQNQEPLAEQKATTEASIVTCEVTVEASAAASTRAQTENPV
jgi:hypothetical protein